MTQNRQPQTEHELEKSRHLRENEAWLAQWHGLETLTADELDALDRAPVYDDEERPSRAA